jgi:hypothetical protein
METATEDPSASGRLASQLPVQLGADLLELVRRAGAYSRVCKSRYWMREREARKERGRVGLSIEEEKSIEIELKIERTREGEAGREGRRERRLANESVRTCGMLKFTQADSAWLVGECQLC